MKVGLLPFRLGEAASVALQQPALDSYQAIARIVTGDSECSLDGVDKARTIALPQALIKDAPELFKRAAEAVRSFANSAECLLVDLSAPQRPDLPTFTLIQSLLTALDGEWWVRGATANRDVVVMLAGPISPDDMSLGLMETRFGEGGLWLVDLQGKVYGRAQFEADARKKLLSVLAEMQEDPLLLLKRKLIRRLGFFRLSWSPGLRKFFYDGRLCVREVERLLKRDYESRPPDQIIVVGTSASWLVEAALGFAATLNIPVISLEAPFDPADVRASLDQGVRARPLVLLSMVDSGKTVSDVAELLKSRVPSATPEFLSVMSTTGQDLRRAVDTKDGKISIRYWIQVDQVSYRPSDEPASAREHLGSPLDLDDEPQGLTAFAFWELAAEVELEPERNVPKRRRKSLGYVPKFSQIMTEQGPWLAYKIDQLLRAAPGGKPVDPVLVCPDQDGANEISRCLRSMFDYAVVRIPSHVYEDDLFLGDPTLDRSIPEQAYGKYRGEEWFSRLGSAAGGFSARAILLDEFTATGGTLLRLAHVCAAVELRVEKMIALADFRSVGERPSADISSLYQIPRRAAS